MKLQTKGRQFYDPGLVPVQNIAASDWEASFDGGETWFAPTDYPNEQPRWLVAGPDADPGTAVVVITADTVRPQLRVDNPPELLVVDGPYIWLV